MQQQPARSELSAANGIDHPRELEPGAALVLPSLPYRDPESGQVYS